jgi:hypothetical protein
MFIEIIVGLVALIGLCGFLYVGINLATDFEPSIYSNFRFSRREMWNKVCSKEVWKKDETSTHDVELTFESFKRFVNLNPEGWSWKREYGIYSCNPCFQPSRKEYYYIRFKTYKDYIKAAAYWHNLGEMKNKRKQELAEAKNTAEFLTIQKQRAKEAEEQAARQMRESEEQIMEILERLKSEAGIPSVPVSPTDEGKTVTLSGSPDMYGWKV